MAQEKIRKKKKTSFSKLFVMVVAAVLVIIIAISVKNIFSLRIEQKELMAENSRLLEEKESLRAELKNVNDYEYIEEQARIQLKLIKPGEILYVLGEEEK